MMLISEGGDSPNLQSHDAEMFGEASGTVVLLASYTQPCSGYPIDVQVGVLGPNTTRATVLLAHQYGRLIINGDELDKEWCNECFFELNDASDDQGPENRDLYLAFNRVINAARSESDGYGVCSVKLSWVCNVANP